MASVLEGLIHSRRRPSRSRSASGKQLHARSGDTEISAPHDGTWSQQHPTSTDSLPANSHGSPDSQKTLVNLSPDLSKESVKVGKGSSEETRLPTQPFIQKERNAITITIPLPWSRKKEHRRPASVNALQTQVDSTEAATTIAELPAPFGVARNIDEVIVAESRPITEDVRADSPIVHTTSPVYDDVSTFFTRAAFPDKGYGAGRLPPIQTSIPPNRSQPASALSVLSPVAEKYDGLSESNNVTPLDNTPVVDRLTQGPSKSHSHNTPIDVVDQFSIAPSSLPTSRITSPVEASDSDFEKIPPRSATRESSRPSSRGPGLGQVAYMRSDSRESSRQERGGSRGPFEGRRSASQDPVSRRAGSAEATYRRAQAQETSRRGASPSRWRTLSRDPALRRSDSPGSVSHRAPSRESAIRRADSPDPVGRRAVSQEPASHQAQTSAPNARPPSSRGAKGHRADSPVPLGRRTRSREPSRRRGTSSGPPTRRAMSRDPFSRRPDAVEMSPRAASLDPLGRRASPREDYPFDWRTEAAEVKSPAENGSSTDLSSSTSADEATDIETETDEIYFESRKGWNGPAVVDGESKGFYAAVIQDYKAIARDVEADIAQAAEPPGMKEAIVNLVTSKKDKEKEKEKEIDLRVGPGYGGPTLVPSHEEMWG